MIIVHHLNNSRSQRILWLLEELNASYEIESYSRDKVTNLAPESLKKIHPLGKSPVISEDGKIIIESAAIRLILWISMHLKGLLQIQKIQIIIIILN